MFRAALFAAAASALLSGCGALTALGEATTPLDAYEMTAPNDGPVARGNPVARDMIVEIPTASGALDTDRIMIRPHPLQAQYLPQSSWSEPAPVMLQTLILRSLENANAFRYVGRRPLGGAGDYALVSDMTEFQAELRADGDSALIRLRVTARLVRESDATILSSRTFTANAVSLSLDTLPIVEAFDSAGKTLLADLTGWVMATLSIPSTPRPTAQAEVALAQ